MIEPPDDPQRDFRAKVLRYHAGFGETKNVSVAVEAPVKRQIEIEARYEEYIRRQNEAVEKFREMERRRIPGGIDYFAIPGLSNELKCKLDAVRPDSFGQAQRIPGMTQAALAAILVYLKKKEMESAASAAT